MSLHRMLTSCNIIMGMLNATFEMFILASLYNRIWQKFRVGKLSQIFAPLHREGFMTNMLADILIKEAATIKVFSMIVYFLFQPQKFSHLKILPYMVHM